jgi:hypothetical protein
MTLSNVNRAADRGIGYLYVRVATNDRRPAFAGGILMQRSSSKRLEPSG